MENFNKFILILTILGLAISSYLIYYHYAAKEGIDGWCDISNRINCQKVLLSGYSQIEGIPLGAFGFIWFLIALLFYYLERKEKKLFGNDFSFYLFLWSVIGLLSVFGLIYVELFLIGSICLFCTSIHILVISIFILSFLSLKKPLTSYIYE